MRTCIIAARHGAPTDAKKVGACKVGAKSRSIKSRFSIALSDGTCFPEAMAQHGTWHGEGRQ
jgi:hypothetical protein